jgi:uncharacterized damage-inducible protein DinB
MLDRDYARLMAEYNAWMNDKIYAACAPLSDEERKRDRGAFFKSIHGTLNHLLWADRAFLIRLLAWDLPFGNPSEVLFEDFVQLTHERKRYDEIILDWANTFEEGALSEAMAFRSVIHKTTRAIPRYLLVVQMFNHQTHHRGQLTTLLAQQGIDLGVTDIPWMPYGKSLGSPLPDGVMP